MMRKAGVAWVVLLVSGVAAVDASTPKGGKEADEIGYVSPDSGVTPLNLPSPLRGRGWGEG